MTSPEATYLATVRASSLQPPIDDLREILGRSTPALRALSGKRLLVTGAAGFLGAYFCHAIALANDELLPEPCRLVCVDTFVTGTPDRLADLAPRDDCAVVNASVAQLTALDADLVVHAASIASPTVYRRMPLETIEVNVLGTMRVLALATAARVQSMLYLSSSEVYGDPEETAIPTPEDYVGRVSFTGPRACYDESKRLAETLCRVYFERDRLPVKVARPFNVYGPTLRLDDGRVIPDLLRQGLAGGPLVLHSDGAPTRSFCYVTDATTAFLDLLVSEHQGEAFNVGTPEEVSMAELAALVGELFDGQAVQHQAATDAHYLTDNPRRRCPDISKIRRLLGWGPRVSLREGLARMVRYYRTGAGR